MATPPDDDRPAAGDPAGGTIPSGGATRADAGGPGSQPTGGADRAPGPIDALSVPFPAAGRRTPGRVVFEYTQAACIALMLALFVRTYLFQMFKIPSASMEDTLLIGDHVVVNKFALASLRFGFESEFLPLAEVRRGDIIIFRYPHDPQQDYVKRVIGLPGETLQIIDQVVYIRPAGQQGASPLAEPYCVHKMPGQVEDKLRNFGPVIVPPDSYFAMGDNRDDSLDSRDWGFVPRENIFGRALFIYWSFDGTGTGTDRAIALPRPAGSPPKRLLDALTAVFRLTRWERSFRIIR